MAQAEPDFRLADGHGYILARGGHLATARLNLQHFLWQSILQFTVHLSVSLPMQPRIADVAAGTAIWALEAARAHPTGQVEAWDLDLTQAPAPGWLPANVALARWDILEDPPVELLGRYDLVHVRLLVLVLSGMDPRPIIRRFRSLLKPGGYLQWEDLDTTRMHVKRADPATESPALDGIIEMSRSGGRHDWIVELPTLLASEGFADAALHTFDDPVYLCRALNDQHLMTMEEFAAGLLHTDRKEAGRKVLDMVRDGYQESLRGTAICYPRVCVVARKV